MADPKVSLQIAAIDAFSNTFSAVQNELVGLQADFNRASKDMAANADKAAKGTENMAKGTGKTKEAVGGLNGALGSMAQYVAGAFSIGAIIGFTKTTFDASLQMDAINSKFEVMTGSSKLAAEEWEFVRAEAKRLKLDLLSTAGAYSSFAVATKNTSMEGQGARDMFIGVGEAAAALHLPAEQSTRVLYQFQQMLSKGKINMEDLKTASESFPGLLRQVADALGITTAQLLDQMQKGELMSADVLPKLAAQLHKTYGAAAVEAANKGRGALNLFTTEVFELKKELGEATSDSSSGFLGFMTAVIRMLKESIPLVQQAKIFWGALFDRAAAWVNAGGLIGMMKGGAAARAELQAEFDAIDAMAEHAWNKTVETAKKGAQKQAGEDARNSQRRRDEAKKTGEELAKIELDYAKAVSLSEMELTATAEKEYQERVRAAKAYYEQKKAAAKSNQEEIDWEKVKTSKLLELQKQHARDNEIIQMQMVQRAVDLRKEGLEMEIAGIKQAAAEHLITERQAEQRIMALTVSSLRDQYDARRAVAEKTKEIYGDNSQEYKKALKDQESSHKSYIDANLAAYKKYSDEIKSLDQQMADFRMSIQQKIADLRQRGMTDEAKYADNQKRFDEAVSKSREALAKNDYDTAQKYAKQAEELASRLADKKAQANTVMQELEQQHQKKIADIQTSAIGAQTDQQKKSTDLAKENTEYEAKKAQLLKEQVATSEGITNATTALNTVEQLGVSIMEAKKKESVDALAKLKEIQDLKLDPKNINVNLDETALAQTRKAMAELTKTETKTIIIKTVSGDMVSAHNKGYFAGGKVASGSPLRDSVSAMLAKNEWVINNRATGFWGDGIMAAINDPLSAAGRRLQEMIQGPSLAGAGGPNMGTINLSIGGESYPVQAPVNVLSQLSTQLRRMKKAGIQ